MLFPKAVGALASLFLIFVAQPLRAQKIWVGSNTDDNWTTAQNWSGGIAPLSSPTTWLGFQDSSHLTGSADSYVPWVVNHIDFESRAYPGLVSFTLSGNPLSFQGASPVIRSYAQAVETINNDIEIAAATLTIDSFLGWPIKFAGKISGNGGVVVTSQAVFSNANTYTGTTEVGNGSQPGTILLTNGQGLGNSISTTVRGALNLAGGIDVDPKPLLLVRGTLGNTSGSNRWNGDITISGAATLSSSNPGETLEVTGTIDGQNGALQVIGQGNVALTGMVKNLTQWGISRWGRGTLTLAGTTLNTSIFNIPDGTLVIASSTGIPANAYVQLNPSTGNVNIPAYPTLSIQQDTVIGGLNCNSSGLSSGGIATVQLGANRLTIDQSFYSSYAGEISGNGGITKAGTGSLELDGSKSFAGGAVIKGGALIIDRTTALGPTPTEPAVNVTLDGGTLEARAYDQSFNPAPMTLDTNRTIYLASTGGLAGTYKSFTVPSLITGPGKLVVGSPALVVLSNSQNDFSGGTLITSGGLEFDCLGAMGGGQANVKISGGTSARAGYPIDQPFLNHLDPSSTGVAVLGVSSSNLLDFDVAGLSKLHLDALNGAAFNGKLVASVYRLGGAVGGNLMLTAADALSGNASLDVAADAASSGLVTLANSNAITGNAVIRSGTMALTSSASLSSGPMEVMPGAVLSLSQAALAASTITIDPGGLLTGCGTINGDVINNGTLLVSGCGPLQLSGNITNNGALTVIGTNNFMAGGSFVNNGILDLMNSIGTQLPGDFTNNGVIYDATHTPPTTVNRSGASLVITINALAGHSYVLQRSAALDPAAANWQDMTSPVRPSVGSQISFGAVFSGRGWFYRVKISP